MTDDNYSVKSDRVYDYREYGEQMDTERQLLETLCLEFDIDPGLIRRLIELEIENERRIRRRGLIRDLKRAIEDYTMEREDDYSRS